MDERSKGYERARKALVAVLPRAADTHSDGFDQPDLVINGQRVEVKWIGEGRLGDARRLLAQWSPRPDVAVARRFSPGAREALSQAGIGWVDETGAAEISTDTIIVVRPGRPERARSKRWTRAMVAVAEAALTGRRATVSEMVTATALSEGTCVNALRALTDLGLLAADAARGRGSARRIVDDDRLLDAYTTAARELRKDIRLDLGVVWRDVLDGVTSLASRLEQVGIGYAVTGLVAAQLLAPYRTGLTTAEIYVAGDTVVDLEAAARTVGLEPVEHGRLTVRPFPSLATDRLSATCQGITVAPWPRVYADLHTTGVRGEDTAEHLREVMSG